MNKFLIFYFQIIIEGIRGSGSNGDIAVDDFDFIKEKCTTLPIAASPTGTASGKGEVFWAIFISV